MIILGPFYQFLNKTICYKKCLDEVLLVSTHNICFYGEIKSVHIII